MATQFINPDGLSKATYSHLAIVTGGKTIYVSGQVSADASGKPVGESFEAQTRQAFTNLKVALQAAGANFTDIVKLNTYVVGLNSERVATFRQVRTELLGRHQPASTLVETGALVDPAFLIEIEAIAVIG